jgi:hypothetical protein
VLDIITLVSLANNTGYDIAFNLRGTTEALEIILGELIATCLLLVKQDLKQSADSP